MSSHITGTKITKETSFDSIAGALRTLSGFFIKAGEKGKKKGEGLKTVGSSIKKKAE